MDLLSFSLHRPKIKYTNNQTLELLLFYLLKEDFCLRIKNYTKKMPKLPINFIGKAKQIGKKNNNKPI